MAILSGSAIRAAIGLGDVVIDPFDEERLNPASYDVRLGPLLRVYARPGSDAGGMTLRRQEKLPPTRDFEVALDAAEEPETLLVEMPEEGFWFEPGIGYLASTVERISAKRLVPVIDGKSSIGRLFVKVHATAGFGDPGFDGQFTLEVEVKYRTRLYPGMRIAQVRFQWVDVGREGDPVDSYSGSYRGPLVEGPVPSAAWKQIERDGVVASRGRR